jgi:ferrous iron transport protein B
MQTSFQKSQAQKRVILVGNPNVGKSVLFNALTGSYTAVSNYPGTSVEVLSGNATIQGESYQVLDTPGMYSLMPITEEERVGREILFKETADVVVHVIDARNIERMLPMTLQLIEAGLPVVLAVNIIDEAERLGMIIDIPRLEQKLGIPVVGSAFVRKRGLDDLCMLISAYEVPKNAKTFPYAEDLESDIERVASRLTADYRVSHRTVALLLLQKDVEVSNLVAESEQNFMEVNTVTREIVFERRTDLHLTISLARKRVCTELLSGVIQQDNKRRGVFGEKLSNVTMNPWTGIPLLLLVLYFVLYEFVGGFGAGTLVDLLEGELFEGWLIPWAVHTGEAHLPWYWLQELIVGEYGLVTLGIRYAVAIILPIVATFFFAFSIIEDSGYFPRLALLVDRIFKRFGMSGRAVIPIVLGLGCDTMAVMVTRTLETVRERIIATILLTLAIPCSAQLGVIMGLLSDVPGALAVWVGSISLLFIIIGLLSARLMPGEEAVFYMELPPMRLPQPRNVLVKTFSRMHWYFLEIFPLFMIASVILWAGKMSGALQKLIALLEPVMLLLGLPVNTAAVFVLGFFRRDFGAAGLYDMQSSGLLSATQLTVAAVTLTLFVPCIAQFLMMKKERGWKVSLLIFVFVTVVAFAVGALLNQLLLATGF